MDSCRPARRISPAQNESRDAAGRLEAFDPASVRGMRPPEESRVIDSRTAAPTCSQVNAPELDDSRTLMSALQATGAGPGYRTDRRGSQRRGATRDVAVVADHEQQATAFSPMWQRARCLNAVQGTLRA